MAVFAIGGAGRWWRLPAQAALALAGLARRAPPLLAAAIAAERERWILWLPVAVGVGVGIYFVLPAEPAAWIAPAGVGASAGLALAARRGQGWLMLALALCAIFCGATIAQWRTHALAAPVLERRWGPAELIGRIVAVEIRPEGRRIILDRPTLPGLAPEATPVKVRVRIADHDMPLHPGDRIALRATLYPPPAPAAPSAFDFQFQAWFMQLGAVGSSREVPRLLAPVEESSLALALNGVRQALVERVTSVVPGPAGTVAATLMTGEQGPIPPEVLGWMRDSGLSHVLVIAGLHLGLVAGFIFLVVRRSLALIPPLALRYPIKKWAALVAFAAITLYLAFTRPTVPTERAWLMGAVAIVAIMIDRTAISMRTVGWAALVVLVLFPETMLSQSFQMSFGAVVTLIATWETVRERFSAWRAGRGRVGRTLIHLAGLALTSFTASTATAPYVLYHFNRFTAYSVVANMIVVPLCGVWIMPWMVIAFMLLPFGLDSWALVPMGWGIEAMLWVGRTVSSWEGAVTPLPAMPGWALALLSLGGVWVCIWRGRQRWLGVPAVVAGVLTVALVRGPDVLVAGDAHLIAVRSADGGLAFSTAGRGNGMVRDSWLRSDANDEAAPWPTSGVSADGRLACDWRGCVYIARSHVVAIARRAEALADDCRAATVLIATFSPRRPCASPTLIVDRAALARDGGHAVWLDRGGGAVAQSVRASRGERPWVPLPPAPLPRAQAQARSAQPATAPHPPVPDDDTADD